jgi:hypothetical protein
MIPWTGDQSIMKPFLAIGNKKTQKKREHTSKNPNLHEGRMEIYQIFSKIVECKKKKNIDTEHTLQFFSAFVRSDHSL